MTLLLFIGLILLGVGAGISFSSSAWGTFILILASIILGISIWAFWQLTD